MQKNNTILMILFTIIIDTLLLIASYTLSFIFRFHSGIFSISKGIPSFSDYLSAIPFFIIIYIIIFYLGDLYKKERIYNEYSKIFDYTIIVMIIFMAFTFIYRDVQFSRIFIIINFFSNLIGLFISRFTVNKVKGLLYKKDFLLTKAVLIADSDVNQLKDRINRYHGFDIVSVFKYQEIKKIKTVSFTDVFIYNPESASYRISEIIDYLGYDLNYHIIPANQDTLTKNIKYEEINSISVWNIRHSKLEGLNKLVKRLTDIMLSSIFILITSPLMLAMSILIKLDSKGPVVYKQTRTTYNKKPFILYKFRSMIDEAEKITGPTWASDEDSRITKIGKLLRRTNLDELPQFFNVLKGDMSLVGPRPERPFFIEKFRNKIPKYIERHSVKSGITGWAQVNGYYGNTSLEERIKHDIYYIENWSILFDIKIILMTVKHIFIRN